MYPASTNSEIMPQSGAVCRSGPTRQCRGYLLDADGLDAVLFPHCLVVTWRCPRLSWLSLAPMDHCYRECTPYARQQYIMVFLQRASCSAVWSWLAAWGPPLTIYLLTAVTSF